MDHAIAFFEQTPPYSLPPTSDFRGAGVYGLYYSGDFPMYARLAERNRASPVQPIYVGKAVPAGWRTGRAQVSVGNDLSRRLREHARSIQHARTTLQLRDFQCRFMILDDVEADLIVPVEAELIRRFTPSWNTAVDGFGNHDPGAGRYDQAVSAWDTLHPGRTWVDKLTGVGPTLEDIAIKIERLLDTLAP